ncbi:DUF4363 family protein [Virgibacillus xinjiangensis]|uniref:DUF4363 family protein n=1 Tax=Virgibacillus xinjiangensis TaxID=393090 RepID=A0ABV7CUQ5_9BACI
MAGKRILAIAWILILLSGCAGILGGEVFFDQVETMESSLDDGEWEELRGQAEELKKLYKKHRWKIQLIGDEGEYEGLYEAISKLIAAAKEEDTTETRVELANVHRLLEDIYSL